MLLIFWGNLFFIIWIYFSIYILWVFHCWQQWKTLLLQFLTGTGRWKSLLEKAGVKTWWIWDLHLIEAGFWRWRHDYKFDHKDLTGVHRVITDKSIYFPFRLYQGNTLSLLNCFTLLIDVPTACKRLWRLCVIAGSSDSKNPDLYYCIAYSKQKQGDLFTWVVQQNQSLP